ncbi:MAG: hypothetical protein MK135_12935, partial [Polyangiaceae bacterium]|nr:hypothetical protein [Polyangiaceae bacterium]
MTKLSAPPHAAIERISFLGALLRRGVRMPTLLALGGGSLLTLFAVAFLGRLGSAGGILSAWFAVGLLLCFLILSVVRYRRYRREIHWTLARIDGALPSAQRGRARRALGLLESIETQNGSRELAQLNLQNRLEEINEERLLHHGQRQGQRLFYLGLMTLAAIMILLSTRFVEIVEGWSVMTAKQGVARMGLAYVSHLNIDVEPPGYLRDDQVLLPRSSLGWSAIEGSKLQVVVVP